MERLHRGSCHCGAITLALVTPRPPEEQILGACQCSFCRKHNARTFSDPGSRVTLTVNDATKLGRYSFGLKTSEVVICSDCGVYVAMLMVDGREAWTTINIDTLDDRADFTRPAEPRDFSAEQAGGRIDRRKTRWLPTELVNWPEQRDDAAKKVARHRP